MDFKGKHIHLMGIGGIGVSSIAQIASERGAMVSGCDASDGPTLHSLRARGIRCFVGHNPSHLDEVMGQALSRTANQAPAVPTVAHRLAAGREKPKPQPVGMLVYSSAVSKHEPELLAARARGLPVVHRAELLAQLAQGRDLIGVAGTHGKTTTTWILANLLIGAGADPTVMLGGHVAKLGGNFRSGHGKLFVTEVDESDGSLLRLAPRWSIITNIDLDHLDHYSGLDHLMETFTAYASQTQDGGAVFACTDCPNVRRLLDGCSGRVVTYGLEGEPDVAAQNVHLLAEHSTFEVIWHGSVYCRAWLSLPGRHNVQNALAAVAIAIEQGVPSYRIEDALAQTPTVGRRLERKGHAAGVTVIDDYGHHPTEIKATVAAARAMSPGRLIGVFQPHRYSRTLHLWKEFAEAFDGLDLLFIAPVYAASEPPIDGVSAELIHREAMARGRVESICVPQLNAVPERLVPRLQPGDTVLTIGAGNVWTVGEAILQRLSREEVAAG